jgi:hypothetical protein
MAARLELAAGCPTDPKEFRRAFVKAVAQLAMTGAPRITGEISQQGDVT